MKKVTPPCPCPCRPRVEALEALVQEQGRQLAEFNIRVPNARRSFFHDTLNVPQVQVKPPFIVSEGTSTTTSAVADEHEVTGEVVPISSTTLQNAAGYTVGSGGGNSCISNAPIQSPVASADVQVVIKISRSSGVAVIQKVEVSTSKKKSGRGTTTATKSGSTTAATATPTEKATKAKVKPDDRYRCVECTASYSYRIALTLHSMIHKKDIFGRGPDLKTCGRCGLEMRASESPTLHNELECEEIRQNRVK